MNIGLKENFSKASSLGSIKNNPTRYSLFELVLVLVVLALFYMFLLKPKMAEQKILKTNYNIIQEEADELSDNLEKLKGLIEILNKSTAETQKLDEALPLEFSSARTNLLIDSLARSSGVTLGQLDVAAKNDTTVAGNKVLLQNPFFAERSLQKVSVSLYAIGSYEQLKSFLQKIESNSRIMDVNILELAGNDDGQLNLKLSLNLFYFGPGTK